MIAAGIDIGGTKIEAQVFDAHWKMADRRRVATPATYDAVIEAVGRLADDLGDMPLGVGSAGLINPATGLALTANLPATGKPFARDIANRAGRPVPFINDCRAMTLSEAVFGAGRGASPVVGLILGTGVGGGVAIGGHLLAGLGNVGGEFGHIAAPGALVSEHGLPLQRCGCGRTGCIETLISGPGLSRISLSVTGRESSPEAVAAQRKADEGLAATWAIWCDLVAELIVTITLSLDPELVILGGGLSRIDGVIDDLSHTLAKRHFQGFTPPRLALAQGGDATGARGAAYFAWQEASHV